MSPWLETIIMIAVPVIVVVIGWLFYSIAKEKGWIKQKNIEDAELTVRFLKLLMDKILKDGEVKQNITLIYNTIIDALEYVKNVMTIDDVEQRKEVAFLVSKAKLEEFGIVLNEEEESAVRFIIDFMSDLVEKQKS